MSIELRGSETDTILFSLVHVYSPAYILSLSLFPPAMLKFKYGGHGSVKDLASVEPITSRCSRLNQLLQVKYEQFLTAVRIVKGAENHDAAIKTVILPLLQLLYTYSNESEG